MILEKTQGSVRTIQLNRPESLNAINYELAAALEIALKNASENSEIRVVVLRGTSQVFSAGGDLKLFHENLETADTAFKNISAHLNESILLMRAMAKPVIGAVQGPAYAAGFGLLLACDLVVASQGAKLSPSFIDRALTPNASSTYFLSRIIGYRRALEALLRGQVFSAKEAQQWGLVNHVWKDSEFEKKLSELVDELANRPTHSLGRIKKLLSAGISQSLHDQLEMEREEISASSLREDFKEGVTAFLEKRKPKFNGK